MSIEPSALSKGETLSRALENAGESYDDPNTEDRDPGDARFGSFNGAVLVESDVARSTRPRSDLTGFHVRVYSEEVHLMGSMVEDLRIEDLHAIRTRLIFCLRSRDPRDGLLPIPLSKNAYKRILHSSHEFTELSLQVLSTGFATVSRMSSWGNGTIEGANGSHIVFQQNATGKSSLSMVMDYKPRDHGTLALVFGAGPLEIDAFIEKLRKRPGAAHWSSPALTALEITAEDFSERIKLRHNDVWKIGHSLGMYAESVNEINVRTVDLVGATRQLNSLFIELAYYNQACQTSHSLLRNIEAMTQSDGNDTGEIDRIRNRRGTIVMTLNDIQYLRSWYDGIQARGDYVTRRAEALLQTVYSLTSQRDSAINLEIAQRSRQVAEQSKEIAQLSRQDNLAMREIAIAAAKDSATMRVIAGVTLFFLPPTFLATFFSASYFDFKPSQPGSHVSAWLWLYFVLSIILLALVMGFWRWSMQQKLKHIQ